MRKIKKVPKVDKNFFEKIFNDYMHELSQFDDTIEFDCNNQVIYKWLSYYWEEKTRFVFYLIIDNQIAGFSMIRQLEKSLFEIAEFYVLPEFRQNNNAMWFAQCILDQFDGNFEFSTELKNVRAVKFWDKVASCYNNLATIDKDRKHWRVNVV